MRYQIPSTATLLKLLNNVKLRVVETATVPVYGANGEVVRRRIVRGYASPKEMLIVVGKRHHRGWAKADDVTLTALHELLHICLPQASERWVREHEMEVFKNPELREAVHLKLLNLLLFPGDK